MKTTGAIRGIIRRIDDLGRVVIPKEIRRVSQIREGDPLEIFTDREGAVILKKYSPIGELSEFAGDGKCESMDIVRLLHDYVNLLEKSGIPRGSMESRIMLEAADAIENLRSIIGFAAVDQEEK